MSYSNKPPDVFISHATGDKKAIAIPLTNLILAKGLGVFRDDISIPKNDSISINIKEGVKQTKVGVIILSQAYLGADKFFTLWELGLLNNHELVYILYNISPKDVGGKMPHLADINGFEIKDGDSLLPIVENIYMKFEKIIINHLQIPQELNKARENNVRSDKEKKRKGRTIIIILVLTFFLSFLLLKIYFHDNEKHSQSFDNSSLHDTKNTSKKSTSNDSINEFSKNNEQYEKYVDNKDFLKVEGHKNAIVAIADTNGNYSEEISNVVADVLNAKGYRTTSSFFSNFFYLKGEFVKLYSGNVTLMNKCDLKAHANSIFLGKFSISVRDNKIINNMKTATLNITLKRINLQNQKTISYHPVPDIAGKGNTESEAKQDALNEYSSYLESHIR